MACKFVVSTVRSIRSYGLGLRQFSLHLHYLKAFKMVWGDSSAMSGVPEMVPFTAAAGTEAGSGAIKVPRQRKKRAADAAIKKFHDLYVSTGEVLGEGSFGQVVTHKHFVSGKEFAVKVVEKKPGSGRLKVLKEIEIFHHCQGHENILQLIEFFEEDDRFYVVFEKMEGGSLLDCIIQRGRLTEEEASLVIRDVARGLAFLHKKGIAHRDLKPENILCVFADRLTPVKICDFDLGSGIQVDTQRSSFVTTPELLSPVGSADFMAPEVVDVWLDQSWSYDKRCDLWSLGTILYILLCGYRPFYATCGQDCGFQEGKHCEDCQELLFHCIQHGEYSFPSPEWDEISDEARDLVSHLLVRDPRRRYTAEQVLNHPWIRMEAALPQSQLATPFILSRNNSIRELSLFAENANAVNRLLQRHLSITETSAFGRPNFESARFSDDGDCTAVIGDDEEISASMFQLGIADDEEDRGIDIWSDEDPVFSVGSPPQFIMEMPGKSSLALRRRSLRQRPSVDSIDSGHLSSASPPQIGFSPPN